MKKLRLIFAALLALLPLSLRAEEEFDMQSFIFGHIGDAYEWHITEIKGRPVSIPLPVIVHSRTSGWQCFLSSKLEEGEYRGFHIAPAGSKYEGKVVETGADGSEIRPFDLSITKNVLGLMVGSLLVVILILSTARWYRKHDALEEAPTGVPGLVEMLVASITDDVIKDAVGKDYEKYAPYLLTVFFFILINNLLGIVPFFPGGANVTGNIAVTLVLAMFTFLMVNLFGNRHYYKDIFWPDVPIFLKAPLPIMPLIEILGMFTKPFSLMVRLFANMLAGHIMILCAVAIIFLTAELGPLLNGSLGLVAVLFGIFLDCLEFLVAFIQAYVFTMLSSVFIGLAHQEPEAE
ncbi:MAG: F0F1 ATP synthase subunit A [Bacteroidales bacterium]|nr:F0F1 ATP synthase subunit A [Bacteroidales bacterium]